MDWLKRRNSKRSAMLGMNHGTARSRLQRSIMFFMAQKLGLDFCFRCGAQIETLAEFSTDHREAWESAADPAAAFFSIENIAFSHSGCNADVPRNERSAAAPHGKSKYNKGCRCGVCVEAKRAYNSKWMSGWREDGNDKSRNNYTGV